MYENEDICEKLLFKCPVHGLQQSVRASRDLCEDQHGTPPHDKIVNLVYTVEGVPLFQFHVSGTFAAAHGLAEGVKEGDHNDPLKWNEDLIGCCMKCFLQRNGGWFDPQYWWHPEQQPAPDSKT